ncbi:hypothetical protein [Maricaulis sp.]|uniref:hypothetical protein n=1 Tax=Maricaulis sp. TaxID=1486257 RepID=UPI003A93C291
MMSIEEFGARGERARLFPVLAESSKEGRTLSIVLATLARVPEFSGSILRGIGRATGKRTTVDCYTEVTFPLLKDSNLRPDGLIVVHTGRTRWSAFVEAKIGNAEVKKEQLESYLKLASQTGVDAVITMTNAYAPLPEHHPVDVDKRLLRKVGLFHFSWFSILTTINLLAVNSDVDDADHVFMLRELERFLLHPSAGLRRFDSMGPEWGASVESLRKGASISKASSDTLAVVSGWHSELRDLCLLLSRKTAARAELRLAPAHRADTRARLQHDAQRLASAGTLTAEILVPAAASPILVEADLTTRTTRVSMKLEAPKDKYRQASCLNWLLRQLRDLPSNEAEAVHIDANWRGRAPKTTSTLAAARADPKLHSHSDPAMLPTSFVVMKMMSDGRRFSGRKTFIDSLEHLVVEDFYGSVAEVLTAWRPPAPKLRRAPEEADVEETGVSGGIDDEG